MGCERSGGVDTGAAIAEALGLNYLFLCEFEELASPLRNARSQASVRPKHTRRRPPAAPCGSQCPHPSSLLRRGVR